MLIEPVIVSNILPLENEHVFTVTGINYSFLLCVKNVIQAVSDFTLLTSEKVSLPNFLKTEDFLGEE